MDPTDFFTSLITGAGGSLTVGGILFYFLRAALNDIKKIDPLETRVSQLEHRQVGHDKTAEEVIRMQEQLKFLIEEVRRLGDKLDKRHNG